MTPIAAFISLSASTIKATPLTIPKKGKLIGCNLSASNSGGSTQCFINSYLSTSADTVTAIGPLNDNQNTSVLAALVGYSVPPATGGNGVNVNQYFPLNYRVEQGQILYHIGYSLSFAGLAWIILYLD